MEYRSIYVEARDGKQAEDIENALNTWEEDGYILHSVIPQVEEGNTEGFIIIFDASKAVR